MWPNLQETADLVTFTDSFFVQWCNNTIFNIYLHFTLVYFRNLSQLSIGFLVFQIELNVWELAAAAEMFFTFKQHVNRYFFNSNAVSKDLSYWKALKRFSI